MTNATTSRHASSYQQTSSISGGLPTVAESPEIAHFLEALVAEPPNLMPSQEYLSSIRH
jgi:hypothetical protein